MLQKIISQAMQGVLYKKDIDTLASYFLSTPMKNFINFIDALPRDFVNKSKNLKILGKQVFANRGASAVEEVIIKHGVSCFADKIYGNERMLVKFHRLSQAWA